MVHSLHHSPRALACLAALACAATVPAAATAATTSTEYAQWTVSGGSGTVEIPGAGFPTGTVTSDARPLRVPSGTSTFLNAATPFGKEFGSSQGKGYLYFGTATGSQSSTTTIDFAAGTPVGTWGFALGDIDADTAKVTAVGTNGKPLTAAQLGWQSAFNYCASIPRPGACTGGASTDEPTWKAATSTLVGNGKDTSGASGWFVPTVPIKSLTILFTVQTGIPIGQLWLAAKWSDAKPDIRLEKTARPTTVKPGGTVTYTITVANTGTADEPDAEWTDDLSDVIDDATYDNDAHATSGTVSYAKPTLTWHGPVAAGATETITYTVTVDDPPKGNKTIKNAVIGDGPRLTCQTGCAVTDKIKKPRKHRACRMTISTACRRRS